MRSTAVLCAIALLAIVLSSGVAADTAETLVVDRIDDGQAVLLVETDGETTDQRIVTVDELPVDGQHEGAVLRHVNGEYVYDGSATEQRSSHAADRLDQLSEQSGNTGDSRFGTCRLGPFVTLWWC